MKQKIIAWKKREELESKNKVCELDLSRLTVELNQYIRRLNVVVRNVFLPENETEDQLNNKIEKIIKEELKLPHVVKDIVGWERLKFQMERKHKMFKSHAPRHE